MILTIIAFYLVGLAMSALLSQRRSLGVVILATVAILWGWINTPLDGLIQFDVLIAGHITAWVMSKN